MGLQKVLRSEKPWGYELLWALTPSYAGKILHINRGQRLSLQYHEKKEETLLVYTGRVVLVFEDDQGVLSETELSPGQAHHIPVGRRHRLIAVEDSDVFEVSTNHLDDVVRVDDAYGRAGAPR